MESTAITGLKDLRSSKTPDQSDWGLPSTRTPACVEQALATGAQRDGAKSLTSNASHQTSKSALPSTPPTITPKQDPFRFLVSKFLRKRRHKTNPWKIRGEEPTETEKRRHPQEQEVKKSKNLVVPAHELDTIAFTPSGLDCIAEAWPKESTDEWTEEPGETGEHRVVGKVIEREARDHSPDGSGVWLAGLTSNAASLMPPNDQADLLDEITGTGTSEVLAPATIPILPSSSVWAGMEHIETRAKRRTEKSVHTTQPKVSEGCTTQPVDKSPLSCEPIVDLSLATDKDLLVLPQTDLHTLSATSEPATQDLARSNSFQRQRRLQQLVEDLTVEGENSPYSASSITGSDDASSRSDHSDCHTSYRCRNGAPNSDSPDSSNDTGSHKQHTNGNISLVSCNQSSDSSRVVLGSGPRQGHEDNERVRTDTRQAQNDEKIGKVIPCPLRSELDCAGKDDNMTSLLRELSNSTHNIFYCNRCKTLLSRITYYRNAEHLRSMRRDYKERWQDHLKSCHDDHCVMSACAPQTNGEVRHKHNENCKTNREDEKEADANYLYRKLGVTELGIEIGTKTDHKGKRRSTARKIVRVAEDAAQRNVELESEIRDRNQELEMLKEVNRERCREVKELKSSNDELCSIIRHALEDMDRENMNSTKSLLDRVRLHVPSAPSSYSPDTGSSYSPDTGLHVQRPENPSHAADSVSHALVGNDSNAMLSNVPVVAHLDGSPTGTSSHLGPVAKRRREEIPTLDERWDQPNSRTNLHAPEYPRPNHRGDVAASAIPATGSLAPGTTSDQEIVAPGLIGVPSHLPPQGGSMASQQDHQQPSIPSYHDFIWSTDNLFSCGDARFNSPVRFDPSPNPNIANPLLPQAQQVQPPCMNFDQDMTDINFVSTIPESPTLGRPF